MSLVKRIKTGRVSFGVRLMIGPLNTFDHACGLEAAPSWCSSAEIQSTRMIPEGLYFDGKNRKTNVTV